MSFLENLLNAQDVSKRVTNDYWLSNGYIGTSSAGVSVSIERAETIATVFACVKVLSEDIAKLPLFVFQRDEAGNRQKAIDHPLYELLHYQPNPWQTSFEWREMLMGHVLLRGNAFAEIIPGGRGGIGALVPRHPDRIEVMQEESGRVSYVWYPIDRDPIAIPGSMMFHLRGKSSGGVRGDSVVAKMRESLGHTIAADEHGSRFFGNAAQAPFAIKHPGRISDTAYKRLKAGQDSLGGLANVGKHMLLEEDMSVEKIGLTNEDSQYLETREFQVNEIARYFRMPPHKIMDLKRATFSNIEHQAIEYVVDTLTPWAVRFELAARRDLIAQKKKFWVEFMLQGLLRGDSAARSAFYSSAIRTGWMNRNEARILENLNPQEGLDEFLSDLNMGANDSGSSESTETDEEGAGQEENATRVEAIVSGICRKMAAQEAAKVAQNRAKYKSAAGWRRWTERFYARHCERLEAALFLSPAAADRYCRRRVEEVCAGTLEGIEQWPEKYGEELKALALEGVVSS